MPRRRTVITTILSALTATLAALSATPALAAAPGRGVLPDNRAWEMVSPPSKNGGDVMTATDKTRVAADGDAVGFASKQAFGDAIGTGVAVDYISRRTGLPGTNGWSTHAITPHQNGQNFGQAGTGITPKYVGDFSADLTKGVFGALSPLTAAPNVATTANLYLRQDLLTPGPSSYQLLTNASAPVGPPCQSCPNNNGARPWIAGTSADLTHVVFESPLNLTAETIGTSPQIEKVYESINGVVQLVGILPDGSPAMCDPTTTCSIAGQGTYANGYADDAVSADGSRVLFAVGSRFPDSDSGLYQRNTSSQTTIKINTSERSVPDAPNGAKFRTATADGSKIFFTTEERLTDDPTAGGVNLYVYDADKPASDPHNLTLMTVDPGLDSTMAVEGVAGVSADGDTAYFLAFNQLLPGLPDFPTGNPHYIYRWHHGEVSYVGAIAETSRSDSDSILGTSFTFIAKTSRVSPDGRYLTFLATSGSGLTGYAHAAGCDSSGGNGPDPEAVGGGSECSELYLFDAAAQGGAGDLTCVSCLPGGALDGVPASPVFDFGRSADGKTSHQNSYLSSDGRFLFFATGSPLVAEDRNGAVQDVYEYDIADGSLHLLSSGRDPSGSYFLEATKDGHNAFFVTRARLSGWDQDDSYDLYDARVDGGLSEPPASVPGCSGQDCQGSAPARRRGGRRRRSAARPCWRGRPAPRRLRASGPSSAWPRPRPSAARRAR